MIMNATVIRVQPGNLLVNDLSGNQEVLVHYRNSNRFSVGDSVRITHPGRMTHSIPPQISATSIQRIQPALPSGSAPAETRAVILQINRGFLLVRDLRNNNRMRVNFAHTHHFCVGQRITVKHHSIIMNNPPEVNAIDITPIC